jgi:valyl-tRNA synthetase
MLKLLHPFMPFITEEIWSSLPTRDIEAGDIGTREKFLMCSKWPEYEYEKHYPREEKIIERAMGIIKGIRNIRVEAEAPPKKQLKAFVFGESETIYQVKKSENIIKNLANIVEIIYLKEKNQLNEDVTSCVIDGVEIFIPLDDLMDYVQEKERLLKDIKKLIEEVDRIDKKLSNQGFVSKAPDEVIAEEKEKLSKYENQLIKVKERLEVVNMKLAKA